MTPVLELDHVSHSFGARVALDGFSIAVHPGEVVAMIGFNGAGKTTAMRVLAGRLRPGSGTPKLFSHDPRDLPEHAARRFGHLVDAPLAHPDLTVTENIRSAARLHGLDRTAADQATTTAVGHLALEPWADARSRTLSQGNRQRLGIACATVHSPEAVVLDEPTSALDPRGVVVVRDLIRELAARGAAILVSSHHLDEVSRMADRIVVVHDGRVVGELEPGGTDLERRFFDVVHDADTHSHPEPAP
ncbi:ABC transporter ATP-binding protein [Myceligenerans pegani]|uniref:ABC transporter ATP-binding protein n=1 Tax=Myceligenerans pegani TaxID=2776917 RepID=A0ABR9MW27_9MICO|nr:ABC transporter ATP-binding protein [Myceligenerans sp. TRM 65318]MBE1875078.1 ABC transporter ATP-binding protein [Myceligenerans sp. TRM 65318]MBE3017349.1 ABC transporter ATP-binding protein [Myceligenerans sp. TRM 65318]